MASQFHGVFHYFASAVGDFTIIILVSITSLCSINNNEIRIWFTIPLYYCKVSFDKNILFADEISFDIPAVLNKIFDSDKTSLSPAKILAGVNDGSIESIRPYLLYRVKDK